MLPKRDFVLALLAEGSEGLEVIQKSRTPKTVLDHPIVQEIRPCGIVGAKPMVQAVFQADDVGVRLTYRSKRTSEIWRFC